MFKNANYLVLFLFYLTHVVFLFFIIVEEKNTWYASIFHIIFLLLISIAYLYLLRRKNKLAPLSWKLIAGVFAGALLTGFLNIELNLGGVLASAIIGVLGVLFCKVIKNCPKLLAAAIYCGSFIGMTKAIIEPYYLVLGIAGVFSGLVFSSAQYLFKGFGGKLGSLAFIGMLFSLVIHYWIWL